MTSVLALDVSVVATGWAFGPVGGRPVSGVIRFAPPGVSDDSVWFAALRWMTEQMTVMKPDAVAIEAAIMASAPGEGASTNPHTQGLLWGLQAVLRTVVKARLGRPAQIVNVGSARKAFTGRGSYPKGTAKGVVQQLCIDLGWLSIEDATFDRADALCVWAKACADIDPSVRDTFKPRARAAA
jgi:hypothetical protein